MLWAVLYIGCLVLIAALGLRTWLRRVLPLKHEVRQCAQVVVCDSACHTAVWRELCYAKHKDNSHAGLWSSCRVWLPSFIPTQTEAEAVSACFGARLSSV